MSESDHEQLADRLEQEAQDMQGRSDQLGEELAETREDWEAKRADPRIPGAPPPDAHPAEGEAPSESAVGPPADDDS